MTLRCLGRDADEARVRDLLRAYRLVTLSGPGGIGKTTLAKAVLLGTDGVLVDLTQIDADADVAAAVAKALGVGEQSTREPAEQVHRHLNGAERLIVLDNCEHVLDGVADFVAMLLDRCRGVAVLATSTERLDLADEVVYDLPPLRTPEPGDDLRAAAEAAAVQLRRPPPGRNSGAAM
jgi:predicted ATPase